MLIPLQVPDVVCVVGVASHLLFACEAHPGHREAVGSDSCGNQGQNRGAEASAPSGGVQNNFLMGAWEGDLFYLVL